MENISLSCFRSIIAAAYNFIFVSSYIDKYLFNLNMLSENFLILQFCGVWRPVLWSSGWKMILYDSYTVVMMFLIYTFTISEFIGLFSSLGNVEEFANGSFMLLTMISVCGKTANMLIKRDKIIEQTNVLNDGLCIPRGPEEVQIRRRCDKDVR